MRRLPIVLLSVTTAVLVTLQAAPSLAGVGQHAAITITSNAGFTSCGCVSAQRVELAAVCEVDPVGVLEDLGTVFTEEVRGLDLRDGLAHLLSSPLR
jgi:hypothetical protein